MNDRPIERFPLPIVIDPPDTLCFQIDVPNDPYHINAFYGAIWALTMSRNWARDEAHSAAEVSRVWSRIFFALVRDSCKIPTIRGTAGADGGDEQMIRQNPDNPCLLETSINGTDWCAFADLSLCVPAAGQPGNGAPQPSPGGGCQSYHAILPGNGIWLLPTIVSTGDTIEITGAGGAAYNGRSVTWHCPGGDQFFAGFCTGVTFTNAGTPMPSVPEGKIIANIGGTFYDVQGSAFTVPGGISNAQVTFQMNSADITINAGQFDFDAQVCNNQAGAWTSFLDFRVNSYADLLDVIWGEWVPGVGYKGTFEDANSLSIVQLHIAGLSSVTITQMSENYTTPGQTGPNGLVGFETQGGFYGSYETPGAVTNATLIKGVTTPSVTDLYIDNNSGTTAGDVYTYNWQIQGLGVKPSFLP